ncbi:hypothetical protein [Microbacterium karelineae]|uniref:hypothetical protein n=1 Tax=Microbacterium karelineae TaxID=2654283 RepID=UPI0012E9B0A0|nr:hypothetical protein [Microbacterium karelineae]
MQARHRHRNFVRLMSYLREHPCCDCGESDPIVLDFDHLPGHSKRFNISQAVGGSTRSWETILSEIAKCEVVCANCHRRRSAERGRFRKHLLNLGLEVREVDVESRDRRNAHGGGAKGRRGCRCDLCTSRRREYQREWEARARER